MNDTLDVVAAARSDSLGWAPTSTEIAVFLERLAGASPSGDDAARIDRISALERLKSAAAAQARETVAFKSSQLAEQRCAGLPAGRRGAGIGAQVALARRESAHRGGRLVGLADALVHELPHTMTALVNGEISEWRAVLVARETCCLTREHRLQVDRLLAADLATLSDRQVAAQARRHAYRLDPHAVVNRASRAEAERRVTIRPAPDTMALVSALLPAAQGVATYAALTRAADAARAAADERTRGQVMADTLVQRVTGQTQADQTPIEVQLVVAEQTLTAGDQTPATLVGYGPLPAPSTRRLLRDLPSETAVWLRRVFTEPATGALTRVDTRRRVFAHALRRQVIIRDLVRWALDRRRDRLSELAANARGRAATSEESATVVDAPAPSAWIVADEMRRRGRCPADWAAGRRARNGKSPRHQNRWPPEGAILAA